jgi:Mor family transcriptional regulator
LTAEQVREIEDAMRCTGGQEVYIKKSSVDLDARAHAIRTRYNLRNRLELQAEFQLSRGQFYRILKGG